MSALEYSFSTLRISQAYVSLQCQSGGRKAISLAWIGDFEIRMHAAASTDADRSLFVIEIFDHDAQLFLDSRACRTLADGATAFDHFLSMAEPAVGRPQ